MSDTREPGDGPEGDFFDQLLTSSPREHTAFTQAFRGYDKAEVDAAIATLRDQLTRVSSDLDAADARHRAELEQMRDTSERSTEETLADSRDRVSELEQELAAARAQLGDAIAQVGTLTTELADAPHDGDEPQSRQQFEAVLRVAEEQAGVLVHNAAAQAERLLDAAREEAQAKRAEAEADVARITAQAQQDADQVRLTIDTEHTAHEARLEREAAHAAEKTAQAEQEAATIRTEAERGAAALRALVSRETTDLRAEAEREVREMNARVLEFEETLTRRQNDAQQEFLVLHNQAVAHAERITSDANEQVTASLEHAQRISAKAEDYERLVRTQAQAIEAEAQVKARETLERARAKAQRIVDSVTGHATGVLRDAEDRTRELRWQQQQLNSYMAEVRELLRPEGVPAAAASDAPVRSSAESPDGSDAPGGSGVPESDDPASDGSGVAASGDPASDGAVGSSTGSEPAGHDAPAS